MRGSWATREPGPPAQPLWAGVRLLALLVPGLTMDSPLGNQSPTPDPDPRSGHPTFTAS